MKEDYEHYTTFNCAKLESREPLIKK